MDYTDFSEGAMEGDLEIILWISLHFNNVDFEPII